MPIPLRTAQNTSITAVWTGLEPTRDCMNAAISRNGTRRMKTFLSTAKGAQNVRRIINDPAVIDAVLDSRKGSQRKPKQVARSTSQDIGERKG
jgi:hypothetical protein